VIIGITPTSVEIMKNLILTGFDIEIYDDEELEKDDWKSYSIIYPSDF